MQTVRGTLTTSLVLGLVLLSQPSVAEQVDDFDYFSGSRGTIRNGVQAVLTCNGLFTSNRTLAQIFKQELAFLKEPIGNARGGNYQVDTKRKMVSVGGDAYRNKNNEGKFDPDEQERVNGEKISAVFREGVGCVVLAPNQTVDDIAGLPSIKRAPPKYPPAATAWPQGDLLEATSPSNEIDPSALNAASDWAFKRDTPEQDTLSLLVVHRGKIIHERYANGVDKDTRTRTWSTAKSIAVTLIGMLVEQGKLELDAPLNIDWLPSVPAHESDPRDTITLRHLLNMSSGLYPVDSFGKEYVTGSGLSYWAGASSSTGARKRGLIRTPGTVWDYENYDTLLAVQAMKSTFKDDESYQQFPHTALLRPLGMHSTLLSTDRFGDFILSSQVYTNARDLARFGLLYLQNGVWNGKRLISEKWIEFVRTPAPASKARGYDYGGQWWLVPDARTDVPKDAYATAGNRGQYVIVVPSHDVVIVRRGLDYGKQGFNRWDLTREVLKAFKDKP